MKWIQYTHSNIDTEVTLKVVVGRVRYEPRSVEFKIPTVTVWLKQLSKHFTTLISGCRMASQSSKTYHYSLTLSQRYYIMLIINSRTTIQLISHRFSEDHSMYDLIVTIMWIFVLAAYSAITIVSFMILYYALSINKRK